MLPYTIFIIRDKTSTGHYKNCSLSGVLTDSIINGMFKDSPSAKLNEQFYKVDD